MKNKKEKEQLKPEDLRSNYVHDKVDIRDRMHTNYWDRENRNFMRSSDMEVLTRMWDELEHYRGSRYRTRFEK